MRVETIGAVHAKLELLARVLCSVHWLSSQNLSNPVFAYLSNDCGFFARVESDGALLMGTLVIVLTTSFLRVLIASVSKKPLSRINLRRLRLRALKLVTPSKTMIRYEHSTTQRLLQRDARDIPSTLCSSDDF